MWLLGSADELTLLDSSITRVELDLDSHDQNFTISGAGSVNTYSLEATSAAAGADTLTLGSGSTLTVVNAAAVGGTAGSSELDLVTPDATSLTIKQAHSSALNAAVVTAAKATSITFGGEDVDSSGAEYSGAMRLETLSGAKATALTVNSAQGARTINTLTAAKLQSLTSLVTMLSLLVELALLHALASVDGSAATAITLVLTWTTNTATIKTGTGNDSVATSVLFGSNLTIDLGESLDNDTLSLTGANNLGLSVIDLSAADQLMQINVLTQQFSPV